MPNPNAVVSTIVRVGPDGVELEGGRRARLDPENERAGAMARVLEGLSAQKLPAYLELDPATDTITRLLIPHVTRVLRVYPIDTGLLGVELELSHARHLLRADAPDAAASERTLREAARSALPLIVTETDDHEIIDVRPRPGGADGFRPPFDPPEFPIPRRWPFEWLDDLWRRIWLWDWWPWWWLRCLSRSRAQQVFDAMNATSCDPLTVPPPCIPFLYPDDGCWGRAHEMYRLMRAMGLKPKKVWIQGNLAAPTRNKPTCVVYWNWHVAPTLCVRKGFFAKQEMVVDPSLFSTPVTKSQWKGAQGDPGASLTDSDGSIFYLWGNVTDPTYAQTNQVLATYRLQLQNRAIQIGPPPYAGCP